MAHWIKGTPIGDYQVEKIKSLGYNLDDVEDVLIVGHCGEKHLRLKNGDSILV